VWYGCSPGPGIDEGKVKEKSSTAEVVSQEVEFIVEGSSNDD